MNAGAYGGEIGDRIIDVTYLDSKTGEIRTVPGAECQFAYRTSRFSEHPDILLSARISTEHGDTNAIRAEMEDITARRREKQPLEYPSAGSTFKRPEGYFAGKLIEDAGLKGFTVGGAQVSEKHAGFVINKGGATCADVLNLMEAVSDKVYAQFGVRLEPEVKILK